MNIVATDAGTLVEVQGTAEGATYSRSTLDAMLDSALAGIRTLTELQRQALAAPYPKELPAAVAPTKAPSAKTVAAKAVSVSGPRTGSS